MSDGGGGPPAGGPRFRFEPRWLALVVPALAAALLGGGGLPSTIAVLALGLGGLLLGLRDLAPVRWLALPLALAVVFLPALSVPPTTFTGLLSGISGLGLLLWLSGRTSPRPSGPAVAGALLLPAAALGVTAGCAVAVAIAGGNPALAGLLAVLAIGLIAYLVAEAPEEASLPAPEEGAPAGSTGS